MTKFRRCFRPRLLIVLFAFFVNTMLVCTEQANCCNARNELFLIHEGRIIEVLDLKKGVFGFFTMLASSLFSTLSDLKTSIQDIKALIEFIFWLQQEELEDEMTISPRYEERRQQIPRFFGSSPDPVIFVRPLGQGIVVFLPEN